MVGARGPARGTRDPISSLNLHDVVTSAPRLSCYSQSGRMRLILVDRSLLELIQQRFQPLSMSGRRTTRLDGPFFERN